MKANIHKEMFDLCDKIAEQYNVKYIDVKDFHNSLRISSENFIQSTPDVTFRHHFEITVFPGHRNFAENYLHVYKTSYVNEKMIEHMKDCINIPCSFITDDTYDKAAQRRPVIIPKDVFYRISSVLKEHKEKQEHVNLIMIHYYLNFKVNV